MAINRRDGECVVLISKKELELFDALIDYVDNLLADRALEEMKAAGEKPVPLEEC